MVTDDLRVVPANRVPCEDLDAVFGVRGPAARCRCQRYRLAPLEAFSKQPVEERVHRLHEQTACGDPDAPDTTGLVAYAGDVAVGWCAVAPRAGHAGLVRVHRTPWDGRAEDRGDPSVWALTCVLARAGHRRAGVSRVLVEAAVPHARAHGVAALEAYPMITAEGALAEELHVGLLSTFLAAGFTEVHRPSKRRAVVRVQFAR
ncbi:N-acetyltransferase family protein [Jatrophihabitans sp. YIM 134969]